MKKERENAPFFYLLGCGLGGRLDGRLQPHESQSFSLSFMHGSQHSGLGRQLQLSASSLISMSQDGLQFSAVSSGRI